LFPLKNINELNTLEIVFFLSVFFLLIQIVYNVYFFRRLIFFTGRKNNFKPDVSIIICAKNEFDNLKNNLKSFLDQDYPNFEIVVVNDQSNDRTKQLLDQYDRTYYKLKVVHIDENVNHVIGKKFALTLGIKTAKYDNLLLTDADCFVSSDQWISSMAHNFQSSDIVLGYGPYKKEKGFLNRLIRFDTYNVAIQYLSYSLSSFTYMGVGRNLAYKKSVFFNNKGFANHLHVASGDDDLFIREVAKNNKVSIEISQDSHTTSLSEETWFAWMAQKRRHLTTSPMYDNKIKALLSIYPFSQLFFFIGIGILISCNVSYKFWMPLIYIKIFLSYVIHYPLMKKFNCFDLIFFQPFYEIFHLVLQGFLFIFSVNASQSKWNS